MMSTRAHAIPIASPRMPAPWSFHLFNRAPWPAPVAGFLLAILTLAVAAGVEFATGRPQAVLHGHSPESIGCAWLLGDYRIGVVGIILLAATTTARYSLARWTRQTAAQLGKRNFVDADTLAARRRWGFLPGALGITICLLFAIDIAERDIEWTSDYWILPHVLNWSWCIPFGWVGGRFIFALICNSLIISRVAEAIDIRDLSQTAPLEVTIRHGSRSALLSLMFLGLISVHFLDPGLNWPSMVFLVALFLIGAVISAWPALGLVQSMYDFRDVQLERLQRELEIEQRQLLDKDPDYEPGRIGDIVALEQRLRAWRLSVFHVRTIVRLMLYAFIGFLSWLGAAAVSAVVENFFGL